MYNKYINEIDGEITNKVIVDDEGQPIDQDFDIDPFANYQYLMYFMEV